MSRATKREKIEAQLRVLEAQFSRDLIDALRECAAGKWGMFGSHDAVIESQAKPLREKLRSPVADSLIQCGDNIRILRNQLGYADSFAPFERYLQYRQMRTGNAPGEPKLAKQFLMELERGLG